jgi:hypothetical protein
MAGAADLYYARRPFGYGRHGNLDRGQVVPLLGVQNDEKLVRLGYLMKLDARADVADCGECPARFVGDAERAAHGSERHRERDDNPLSEDERAERRERRLEQEAPLFVENSKASRQIAGGKRIRVPTT